MYSGGYYFTYCPKGKLGNMTSSYSSKCTRESYVGYFTKRRKKLFLYTMNKADEIVIILHDVQDYFSTV